MKYKVQVYGEASDTGSYFEQEEFETLMEAITYTRQVWNCMNNGVEIVDVLNNETHKVLATWTIGEN